MTNLWQPGTYYGPGSEVKYNGAPNTRYSELTLADLSSN